MRNCRRKIEVVVVSKKTERVKLRLKLSNEAEKSLDSCVRLPKDVLNWKDQDGIVVLGGLRRRDVELGGRQNQNQDRMGFPHPQI